MSRKISIQEKKKWLAMFEQESMTENQVALHVGKDLRTVVNGLQEASRQRSLANAESEMLRTALQTHQGKLMEKVTDMANMLVLPDVSSVLREDAVGQMVPISVPGGLIERDANREITLKIYNKEKLEWELLQAHLKSDKLWKQLDRWEAAMTTHIKARWVFKISIKNNLEAETGLKFKGVNDSQTEYLLPTVHEIFYEVSIRKILGIKDGTDLEHTITAEKDGIVKHLGNNLAVCKKTTWCKDKIIDVLTYLPTKTAAQEVNRTYTELEVITRIARRQIDEILSLGMIMGKCRVCSRLGR
jgi:bifunctional DNA-binding transcriptional regulator/antitoxin component of YhaV-PrlF toxin-antitoxin module